jgi:hypothetical protein
MTKAAVSIFTFDEVYKLAASYFWSGDEQFD